MRNILLFTFVCLAFTACKVPRYAYGPSASNVPVLTKKGDSKLGGYYSSNGTGKALETVVAVRSHSNGCDIQADYAVTDHIALQTSYFYRSENNGNPDFATSTATKDLVLRYKRNLAEFGVGYYTSLNSSKSNFFQVFGGAGFGRSNINEMGKDSSGLYDRFNHSKMTKYYIQPAFVFMVSKNFAISLSSRFSIIKFNNITTNYTADQLAQYKLAGLASDTYAFWEPAFINSFGFTGLPAVRFEYQLGKSYKMNHDENIDIKGFNFSIGAFFDIAKILSPRTTMQ